MLGHAFLQPGEWGRFKGLPVRRDVAEGLIDQGITVLRYGGSMVNHAEYRWKKMIGPRDRRPPYAGTWYRYSSNGWGILDFMDFCEAAGFEYIPAFNMGETPQDMADFIEYAKGAGRQRRGAASAPPTGIREPYRLHYIELGNEERVDENYCRQVQAAGRGDLGQGPADHPGRGRFRLQPSRSPIPFNFGGAASASPPWPATSRSSTWPKQHDREVWFDVHVGTDGPRAVQAISPACAAFIDALAKIADGAQYKVVVFEFNAGNHAQRRALANALAINAIERDGRMPDRHLGQLPPARRPERQRLGPGPALPQPVAGLAPAARLRDADVLAQLPAATGPCDVTAAAADWMPRPRGARTARRWSCRSSIRATGP